MLAPYFWLQPAATSAGAGLLLASAAVTVRQRRAADRKDQWWKRTQWAFDQILKSRDARARELGFRIVDEQALSKLADVEDSRLLEATLAEGLVSRRPSRQTRFEGRT